MPAQAVFYIEVRMTPSPILMAKHIRKVFTGNQPLEVLKDLSFEVNPGETIAITGKSGSGKSTLLNILGTLEPPTSGELILCGQAARSSSAAPLRNKHIGFIFQAYHLLDDFSLLENVLMPAKIARKDTSKGSESYERALTLLREVDLLSKASQPTKTLSGGEKQRACLARALGNNPDIILADEPTGNLDSVNSEIVATLLLQAAKNEKKSLILVTHDLDLAQLCDKTFQLKDGLLHRAG